MSHLPPHANWIDLEERFPEPHEAMVMKFNAEGWLGVVIGLYQGREVTAIVMSSPERTVVAPMVPNGVDQELLVTHYRAWPQADIPIPQDAIDGLVPASSHCGSHKPGARRQ